VRRRRPEPFRPRVTLTLVYFAALVLLYGLLFALPALVTAFQQLPPAAGELTPEELATARETARSALAGRIPWVLAAALVTLGLALWRAALPGLRR
jgi:hypothetical protein